MDARTPFVVVAEDECRILRFLEAVIRAGHAGGVILVQVPTIGVIANCLHIDVILRRELLLERELQNALLKVIIQPLTGIELVVLFKVIAETAIRSVLRSHFIPCPSTEILGVR